MTKAKQTLVTGAKAKGVKVKTVDARATCTADAHFPNTFSCKLSERRKRCKGTTSIYAQGAVSVARARDTRVTCSKQR